MNRPLLAETVAEAARRFGDRAAFQLADGTELSYRELDRASDEVAAGLAVRGLGPGSVLLLSLPSGLEYAVGYLAAAKVGAATAGANPRLRARERALIVEAVDPDLIWPTMPSPTGFPKIVASSWSTTVRIQPSCWPASGAMGGSSRPSQRTLTGRPAFASRPVPPAIPAAPGSPTGNW